MPQPTIAIVSNDPTLLDDLLTDAGWPLLKLLQVDPTTMHIPVLVSITAGQFVRDKATLLACVEAPDYRTG